MLFTSLFSLEKFSKSIKTNDEIFKKKENDSEFKEDIPQP